MPHAFSRAAFACLAFGGLIAFASSAAAAEDSCAATYDQILGTARSLVAAHSGVTFVDYSGSDARKIIARMNAVEPVSDWTAEHIIAIDPDGEQAFRVGVVDKGCMTHAFPIPREAWMALLSDALGDRS